MTNKKARIKSELFQSFTNLQASPESKTLGEGIISRYGPAETKPPMS